jgi:hypothetical protein
VFVTTIKVSDFREYCNEHIRLIKPKRITMIVSEEINGNADEAVAM